MASGFTHEEKLALAAKILKQPNRASVTIKTLAANAILTDAAVLASFSYTDRMIIAERLVEHFTFVPGWIAIVLEAGFDQSQAGRLLLRRLRAIRFSAPTPADRKFIEFLRAEPKKSSHACRGALMAGMDEVEQAFRRLAPEYADEIRGRFVTWILKNKGRWRK